MTILVTGATGNVGREVVRALQAARLSFVAGDRDVDRGRKALGPDVAVRPLDFTRPETYPAAVEGMAEPLAGELASNAVHVQIGRAHV